MNHEHLSNNQDNRQNSNSDQISDSFEKESTPRNRYSGLGRFAMHFLGHTKFPEVRENPEQFEDFIQSLDTETAMDYLKRLNGMLRGVNFKERGYHPNMTVGPHLAPAPEIQKMNYTSALEAMKQIKNPRYRAALAYYTINNQHTFGDGNGRTSRSVFEILDNPNFNLDQSYFQHKDGRDKHESGENEEFEEAHHLQGVETTNHIINKLLTGLLVRRGEIDPRVDDVRIFEIWTGGAVGEMADIYFTPEAESSLTDSQKATINFMFIDHDIAKLALGEVLQDKGTADDIISESLEDQNGYRKILIDTNQAHNSDAAKKTFANWTAEDYGSFVQRFYQTQVYSQQVLNNIFLHPEKFPLSDDNVKLAIEHSVLEAPRELSDDQTLADWLTTTR